MSPYGNRLVVEFYYLNRNENKLQNIFMQNHKKSPNTNKMAERRLSFKISSLNSIL